MYKIYFLIKEDRTKTYIGMTDSFDRRLLEHRSGKVHSTKEFGNFTYFELDTAEDFQEARKKERYYKSCAGRKKLKKFFQ